MPMTVWRSGQESTGAVEHGARLCLRLLLVGAGSSCWAQVCALVCPCPPLEAAAALPVHPAVCKNHMCCCVCTYTKNSHAEACCWLGGSSQRAAAALLHCCSCWWFCTSVTEQELPAGGLLRLGDGLAMLVE